MTGEAVNAATVAFNRALIERALSAELSYHLGYASGAARPDDAGNQRNGKSAKTVLTDDGPLRIEVPRGRTGSFDPVLIPKHERRFTGFDDKVVAMYLSTMSSRTSNATSGKATSEFRAVNSQRSPCWREMVSG